MKAKDVRAIVGDGGRFRVTFGDGSHIGGEVLVYDDMRVITVECCSGRYGFNINIERGDIASIEPLEDK